MPLLPHQRWQTSFSGQAQALCGLVLQENRAVVHVLPQDKDVASLAMLCRFLAPEVEVLTLPAWDTLPYDRVSPSAAIQSERLATLGQLARRPVGRPYILLTTLNAASQRLVPKAELIKGSFSLKAGMILNHNDFQAFLSDYGYHRSSKVMEAGEYSLRGSIIDIFPAGAEEGIRIDLFGDEIESLKRFDPLSQISGASVERLDLLPVSEAMLGAGNISRFRTRYLELFGAVTKEDPLYTSVSAARPYAGMEHWLPLFYESLDTLAEYTPEAVFSMDYRIPALHAERWEAIADYYGARVMHAKQKGDGAPYHPIAPTSLFLDPEALLLRFAHRPHITMTPMAEATATDLKLRSAPQLFQHTRPEGAHPAHTVLERLASCTKTAILAANSAGSLERMRHLLEAGFRDQGEEARGQRPEVSRLSGKNLSNPAQWPVVESLADALLPDPRSPTPDPCLTILPIEQGLEAPDFLLLSEQDMFGERIIRTAKKKRKSEAFMQEAASFGEGELLVHREHGIGRYEGLITVEVNGTRHDCLKLTYEGGDKLFLPVENIELVSRYGSAEEGASLDKLGGVAWQKRKAVLKKRLKIAAEALLKVAAERLAKPAPVFAPEAGLYDEFCARFPYTETDDQLQAIEEVRSDLLAGHAMDRLVCGDVGFGKTEVALRAAFTAAASGAQVAVIAPTTLLARQHFRTFATRFEGLPLTVRMLSRLTSAKDAAATKTELAEGKVDIVVGTHALLGAGVTFARLGLLIVDEEQHFGVGQKEKLKALKTDVHVLTLSATPIPRTLQMALTGVRELSLITTPPLDRLAVRTYVMPTDPVITREALLREYHRGGKSFYVTPRVKYLAELHQKLRDLVPELKIAVAHGQLAAGALEAVMNDFYDGKYDILLSTTIIESGIDIPTANTMIIDRAHLFGLSQLYQLRGRVGRSKTRAYCYFTLPHHQLMTREAERRLEVMQQLDSLGAGFQLASHDMDIRGCGNLLGEEQSGHVREVGVELYQAMLEETVTELKRRKGSALSEELSEDWSPQINLGMSVLIPESYIEDLGLRLSLYRRASTLADGQALESFAAEMIDRFGKLPVEVEHFLRVLEVKLLCKRAGIVRLDAGPKGVVVAFYQNRFTAPDRLLAHLTKHAQRVKLRPDQSLFFAGEAPSEAARLQAATQIAGELVGLVGSTAP